MDPVPSSARSPPPASLHLDIKGTPVNTINYVPYLSFARRLFKLTNRKGVTGESMAIEAKVLVDKWHARGLSRDVLVAIRFENFSINEPKP
jgi:ribosomal protein S28E/S33